MACTVFPTPISSARSNLPLCWTPNCTPSLWKGRSAFAKDPGMQLTLASTCSSVRRCGTPLHRRVELC